VKNYKIQIRTWSGQYVACLEKSAISYFQALKELKEQYTNHRFTIVGVSPCELCEEF
jgi:hypothetical protein